MKIEKRSYNTYYQARKSWGHEVWLENNDEYCGKELHFNYPGDATSLHFHVLKRETMYCVVGAFRIHYVDPETAERSYVDLFPGDSVEIPRLVVHSIEAVEADSLLLEFSTKHYDEDSYRVGRIR